MHWAAPLIGRPWEPGAEGPDAFDCWGLVRFVFRTQYGIEMPPVSVGVEGNVGAIKRAAEVSGWRLASAPAQAGDILLLRAPGKRRHVALVIDIGRRLAVLHANGYLQRDGRAVGCVERQSLGDLLAGGYRDPEFWRCA